MQCLSIPTQSRAADALAWAFHTILQVWPKAAGWRPEDELPWNSVAMAYGGQPFQVCQDSLGAERARAGEPTPLLSVWYEPQEILVCSTGDLPLLDALMAAPGWRHLAQFRPCPPPAPPAEAEHE